MYIEKIMMRDANVLIKRKRKEKNNNNNNKGRGKRTLKK